MYKKIKVLLTKWWAALFCWQIAQTTARLQIDLITQPIACHIIEVEG